MLQEVKQNLDKAIHHLETEFGKLQMGRATPAIVEDIMVEQYGSLGPIKNTASINVLDPQTLSITPWDKELVVIIVKAITEANIGLNPQNMWESIMIKVPRLTEERRKEMCKVVKKFAEDAKVSVRNMRADAHKAIKKQEVDKEISEDMARDLETDLQKQVDEVNKKIDEASKHKEADIMKV